MAGIVFGCITPHPPLLIPDVGQGKEQEISGTIKAMQKLAGDLAAAKPDMALIISPHGQWQYDAMGAFTGPASQGDMLNWGSKIPGISLSNDTYFVKSLVKECEKAKIPVNSLGSRDYLLDHGVMVPLHFLLPSIKGVPLVPLTFSALPLSTHLDFGRVLHKVASSLNKRAAIIASGDLSHRLIPGAPAGYDPKGKEFDEHIVRASAKMDIKSILDMNDEFIERAGECGLRSIVILMGALQAQKVKPEILSYEGPFGVGYLVASFKVENKENG